MREKRAEGKFFNALAGGRVCVVWKTAWRWRGKKNSGWPMTDVPAAVHSSQDTLTTRGLHTPTYTRLQKLIGGGRGNATAATQV